VEISACTSEFYVLLGLRLFTLAKQGGKNSWLAISLRWALLQPKKPPTKKETGHSALK
jgi:hypothetical protein